MELNDLPDYSYSSLPMGKNNFTGIHSSGKNPDKQKAKLKCYELYQSGHSMRQIKDIMMQEFGLNEKTIYNYTLDLREELKRQFEDRTYEIRERLVLDLIDMKNQSTDFYQRLEAIRTINKLLGLEHVNVNVNNRTEITERKFIITTYEEEQEKKEDDNTNDNL